MGNEQMMICPLAKECGERCLWPSHQKPHEHMASSCNVCGGNKTGIGTVGCPACIPITSTPAKSECPHMPTLSDPSPWNDCPCDNPTCIPSTPAKPKIVCLCGSTRFSEAFQKAQFDETMAGKIVLTIGCNMKSDTELFKNYSEQELKEIKTKLDELHKRKIDLANEVLILNVDNYIGESTTSEMSYAYTHNKPVRFLNPSKALDFNWNHLENRIWKDTKGGI